MAVIAGGLACLIHAVLPCAFSGIVRRLYQRMVTNRTAAGTSGAIVAAE